MIKLFYAFLIWAMILFFALKSNAKIIVYEIDTGIDAYSHQEIRSHVNVNEGDILNFFDGNAHGTHIAGLILKDTCPEVELKSCSWFKLNVNGSWNEYISCIRMAESLNPNIINISSSGNNYDSEEYQILKQLGEKGIKIVVAAGNNGKDLSKDCKVYPACYKIKNLIAVGNLEDSGARAVTSNYGIFEEIYLPGIKVYSTFPGGRYGTMSGTSQSTAKETNKLLKDLCKNKGN